MYRTLEGWKRALFDISAFDPPARRFQGESLAQTYVTNEKEKRHMYSERVLQIENGIQSLWRHG